MSTVGALLSNNFSFVSNPSLYRFNNAGEGLYNINVGTKALAYTPFAADFYPGVPREYNITPDSFAPGPFSNNPVNLRIRPRICGDIQLAVVEMKLSEVGGTASVTCNIAPYLIESIQTFYNGAIGDTQQFLNADALYCQLAYCSNTIIDALLAFNSQNMGQTKFFTPTAIPAGGQAIVRIPLLYSFVNHLNPDLFNSDYIVQIRPAANGVNSGTGVLQLTSITLKLYCNESQMQKQAAIALGNQNMFRLPYTEVVPFQNTYSLAAGTATTFQLQLSGYFIGLEVMIRSSLSYTAGAINTFSTISGGAANSNEEMLTGSLDLLDMSQNTILGSGGNPPYYFRTELPLRVSAGGDFSSAVPIYHILFVNSDMAACLKYGLKDGGIYINNNLYVSITPGHLFVAGNYIVTVLGYRSRESCLTKGRFVQYL